MYDVLKPVLVEKEKAENRLKELGKELEFVIIRPGGLKSEPATHSGVLTEDTSKKELNLPCAVTRYSNRVCRDPLAATP